MWERIGCACVWGLRVEGLRVEGHVELAGEVFGAQLKAAYRLRGAPPDVELGEYEGNKRSVSGNWLLRLA